MFIRTTKRRNKDGTVVEYASLAHNYRDGKGGHAKPHILYNFGRAEQVDMDALRRLVDSIEGFMASRGEAPRRGQSRDHGEFDFVESRSMGTGWLLHGVWEQLGIGSAIVDMARKAGVARPEELAACIFAMVANRAVDPCSKHATPEWLADDVYLPGVPWDVYDEQLYRAMDFLLQCADQVQRRVYFATATLLNLEVDLLLYDTTSAYFEMEDDDVERAERSERWATFDDGNGSEPSRPRPQVVNDPPLRLKGYSRDKRSDLAQVVVGLAVTREGIPVRSWVWPGNTNDAETVVEVKKSLQGWQLNRVVWAVDRGMVSDANLAELRRGGGHFIAGKKMRSGEAAVEEALARPGRYKQVSDNLFVKAVVVGEGERRQRFVVLRNPAQEERDRQRRSQLVAQLEAEVDELNRRRTQDAEGRPHHSRAVCALKSHPIKKRYVRELKNGELRIDRGALREEERLDGKHLVMTSDDTLSAEDVALGYKQLTEVEAAWRSLKTDLCLRPMQHRKAERIEAHVLLCWLALLLVRVSEVRCGQPWPRIRRQMDRLHRGVFQSRRGWFVKNTRLNTQQKGYLKALSIREPPEFEHIATAPRPVEHSTA